MQRSSSWTGHAKSATWRMHVVYICISVLHVMSWIMTVQLIQFCPSLLHYNYYKKHCIKRVLETEMNGYRCFNFTEKTFLRSVDPIKKPKNVKFSLWSIIETLPRGGAWLFRGAQGGAKRGPLKIRPWVEQLVAFIVQYQNVKCFKLRVSPKPYPWFVALVFDS